LRAQRCRQCYRLLAADPIFHERREAQPLADGDDIHLSAIAVRRRRIPPREIGDDAQVRRIVGANDA
jgi:hypothetical protein